MGYTDEKAWRRGAYSITTNDTALPFALADVKKHIRVESSDTFDDDLITSYIMAVVDYLERMHGLVLRPKTMLQTLDAFPPDTEPIALRLWPVRNVVSVKYLDAEKAEQTFDSAAYIAKTDEQPAKIYTKTTWPSAQQYPAQVRVSAQVGYADNASIPKAIFAGVCLMVNHWYDNRSDSVRSMPTQAEYILQPYLIAPKV